MKNSKKEQLVYMDDLMYLPIQYHRIQVKQPSYQGEGVHSVKELEEICKQFMEFTHQQNVIKHNVMRRLIKLKFGDNNIFRVTEGSEKNK